jgi:NADH:ubiquinone oxidoreductase subunit 6 (subunit J)
MTILFYLIALVAVAAALGVVLLKNPLYSALALVSNMIALAALYAQLDAHFLAAAQVVVYAGAIMVLVIFVLMLLNAKEETPTAPGLFLLIVGGVIAVVFLTIIIPIVDETFQVFRTAQPLQGTTAALGITLFSRFIAPFECASLLIMASILGAVYLARRRVGGLETNPTPNPGRAGFQKAVEHK